MVQWDVLALGDDFHTFHVHGHRWRARGGALRDSHTVETRPDGSFTVRFRVAEPGTYGPSRAGRQAPL